MTTSRRFAGLKVQRFEDKITQKGQTKKRNGYPVKPIVLGFFIFVVVGSSLFQIIRTMLSGGMA